MSDLTKEFIKLVSAAQQSTENLNTAWRAVIGYAVKKAYGAKDLSYAQTAVDSCPAGLRKGLVSSMRKLGLNIAATDRGQFLVQSVLDPSKQGDVFDKIKNGTIADVVDVADKISKPKNAQKPLEGTPAERATKALTATIKRLKDADPDASAALNDIMAKKAPEGPVLRKADGKQIEVSPAEMAALVDYLSELRTQETFNLIQAGLKAAA